MALSEGGSAIHPLEIFGLRPLVPALRQCWAAIAGDAHAPPSQWGPSSLRILRPWLSVPIWLGREPRPRRAVIYNLPNRCPQPTGEGYSVRVTYARDYRGRRLSYDGHVGTDFAVPAGTTIVAAAPGVVVDVRNDMQRGGLKVCIEHGGGLLTTSNHLSRALVEAGNLVGRGEPIGLSGMSGVDGVLFFPWLAPHLHFNVLLDGLPVDPFARRDETSLWRSEKLPMPHRGDRGEPMAEATRWSRAAVDEAIATCRDDVMRAELEAVTNDDVRAARLTILRLFHSSRFAYAGSLTDPAHGRRPWLDLPLRAEDYDGVVFADEL